MMISHILHSFTPVRLLTSICCLFVFYFVEITTCKSPESSGITSVIVAPRADIWLNCSPLKGTSAPNQPSYMSPPSEITSEPLGHRILVFLQYPQRKASAMAPQAPYIKHPVQHYHFRQVF